MAETSERPFLGANGATPYARSEIAARCLWALVQATLFRWSPRPLHGFRIWLLRLFGAKIDVQVRVFPSVRITFPWRLRVESRVCIGANVALYNLGNITIRRGATVSQNCHLCAGTHDFNHWSMPLLRPPIVVGENAWLAADVFVGPGVTVGDLCVVGARSVVIRDLPPRTICVGHPCRPVKERLEPTA